MRWVGRGFDFSALDPKKKDRSLFGCACNALALVKKGEII